MSIITQSFPSNTAIIGQQMAKFVTTANASFELSNGGTNFHLYINNILQVNGFGTAYNAGDSVKIIPFSSGFEDISIISTVCGSVTESFTIVNGPLPVRWMYQLTGKVIKTKTHITWSVATQINNEKYIIEYSKDGRTLSQIGEIAGDGNSNVTKHYEYIHTSPSIGMNYYRIKQVDYDGKYSYSDIASVRYDGTRETNIYPNPTTSEVNISTSEPTSLQIMDIYGRVLKRQNLSEGQNTVEISELPSGILIFVVGDCRFKVLKE